MNVYVPFFINFYLTNAIRYHQLTCVNKVGDKQVYQLEMKTSNQIMTKKTKYQQQKLAHTKFGTCSLGFVFARYKQDTLINGMIEFPARFPDNVTMAKRYFHWTKKIEYTFRISE